MTEPTALPVPNDVTAAVIKEMTHYSFLLSETEPPSSITLLKRQVYDGAFFNNRTLSHLLLHLALEQIDWDALLAALVVASAEAQEKHGRK